MKKLIALPALLLLLSCGNSETVTIPKNDYQKLIGDTIKPKYPKKVFINSNSGDNVKDFEVFLGSDGHEYQSHGESHIANQWTHYAGCELCKSRLDTILKYIKKR